MNIITCKLLLSIYYCGFIVCVLSERTNKSRESIGDNNRERPYVLLKLLQLPPYKYTNWKIREDWNLCNNNRVDKLCGIFGDRRR